MGATESWIWEGSRSFDATGSALTLVTVREWIVESQAQGHRAPVLLLTGPDFAALTMELADEAYAERRSLLSHSLAEALGATIIVGGSVSGLPVPLTTRTWEIRTRKTNPGAGR